MNAKQKRILSNPWIIGTGSSVLAVIVLRFIDSIANTKILSSIWQTILSFFHIKYTVSLWFLILLPILVICLILLIFWILSLFTEKVENTQDGFSFLDYTEDQFGPILYRWDYIKEISGKYIVNRINHYCPECRCAIVNGRCPICHESYYNKEKPNEEVLAIISHQIEKRSNSAKTKN